MLLRVGEYWTVVVYGKEKDDTFQTTRCFWGEVVDFLGGRGIVAPAKPTRLQTRAVGPGGEAYIFLTKDVGNRKKRVAKSLEGK